MRQSKLKSPHVTLGTGADDSIVGGIGSDRVYGGSGDDTLVGGPTPGVPQGAPVLFDGNDTIFGGNGNDRIHGGTGKNTLYGGNGSDSITADHSSVRDFVYGGTGDDNIELDSGRSETYGGAGADWIGVVDGAHRISGGRGNDYVWSIGGQNSLSGGTGSDRLVAGRNADRLFGGEGNDLLHGNVGHHLYYGGSGDDLLRFDKAPLSGITSGLKILLDTGETSGQIAGSFFTGIEKLVGSKFDDEIRASGGMWINGGAGNDTVGESAGNHRAETLEGGLGNDLLHGRLDVDGVTKFAISGDDTIVGFDREAGDKFIVRASEFPGLTFVDLINSTVPLGEALANSTGPQFVFLSDLGTLWFDADGDGVAATPRLVATINPTMSDFGFFIGSTDFEVLV